MTTTSHFQKLPDSYSQPIRKSCRVNTNPRYKFLKQTHFTAGDEGQFREFILYDQPQGGSPKEELWKGYQNPTPETIQHTFQYLFYKFKKGTFVQIRDNKLAVFLPFTNVHYKNEWYQLLQADDPKRLARENIKGRDIQEPRHWYANNGLFRFEKPFKENDTGLCALKHMLETLCKECKVPDADFFINKRDFPLLKKNLTEPYTHLFGDDTPLVSHRYSSYTPILSQVSHDEFADIAMPTHSEWANLMGNENVFFPTSPFTKITNTTPWERKKNLVVFRGSSTGVGTTIETNPRLRMLVIAEFHSHLFDVGITNWNTRLSQHQEEGKLQAIVPSQYSNPNSNFLTMDQQAGYKYILHIEGHTQAFRLATELTMGCVILKVECEYQMWFEKYMEEYIHYIPVKKDLSNLVEQVNWCHSHQKKCMEIVENCKKFSKKYITKKAYLNEMVRILTTFSQPFPNRVKMSVQQEQWKYQCLAPSRLPVTTEKQYPFRTLANLKTKRWRQQSFRTILVKNEKSCLRVSNDKTLISKSPYSLHEYFIGKCVVNNLLRHAPNFCYTFGEHQSNLVLENLPGQTLSQYLKSPNFNFDELMFILQQVGLALTVAQNRSHFTHYDCTPWNIVLHHLPKEEVFDYSFNPRHIYRVRTKCVPILIDYERSTGMYDFKMVYGEGPFASGHDLYTLTITVLHALLRFQKCSLPQLQTLLNWIQRCDTMKEIKDYVMDNHYYSNILYEPKGDLQKTYPLTVVMYDWCGMVQDRIEHVDKVYYTLDNGHVFPSDEEFIQKVKKFRIQGSELLRLAQYQAIERAFRPKPVNLSLIVDMPLFVSDKCTIYNLDMWWNCLDHNGNANGFLPHISDRQFHRLKEKLLHSAQT